MNTVVENIIEEPVENTTDDEKSEAPMMRLWMNRKLKASSEFAIKLVNSVKSLNNEEITHYELVNLFNSAEELDVYFFSFAHYLTIQSQKFIQKCPLFFKGVMVPQSFDLSEEMAQDIETFMKGQNSEYYSDLRLHDLEQPYLDAYESRIRIYNDMVEKTRDSYHTSVKLAKTQVFEISAVFVCLFILALTLIGIS